MSPDVLSEVLAEKLVLPGMSFRSVMIEDAPLLFAVHEQCIIADQVDSLFSIEYVPTQDSLARWIAKVVEQEQTHNWQVAQAGDTVIWI